MYVLKISAKSNKSFSNVNVIFLFCCSLNDFIYIWLYIKSLLYIYIYKIIKLIYYFVKFSFETS